MLITSGNKVWWAEYPTSANSQALISSISFSVHTLERSPTSLGIEKYQ